MDNDRANTTIASSSNFSSKSESVVNGANGSEAAGSSFSSMATQNTQMSSTTDMGNLSSTINRTSAVSTSTTTTPTTNTSTNTSTQQFPFAVHFFASFHKICVITALFPLVTLFSCFVSAYVFQYDDVHETHCRVYNIIPSISAITGVSPQTYFWRFSIALHVGPRIPIAFVYRNYYRSQLALLKKRAPEQLATAELLIPIILVLNCIEVAALAGVTYISNRENYPVHEKIFITFMICSLLHMLMTIKLNDMLHADLGQCSENKRLSIQCKKLLFATSIISTIGLLIFFAKHRFYCHELAFSWFAFFEYIIAIANMLFHFTIIWDFPPQYMLVVQGSRTKIEQIFNMPKKLD